MKRSRINPINRERATQQRETDFGSRSRIMAIASMPCVCGGQHPECTRGWSEPSHVISRAAGGTAEKIAPMSTGCHRAWHRGRETYMAVIGKTLDEMIALALDADALAKLHDEVIP